MASVPSAADVERIIIGLLNGLNVAEGNHFILEFTESDAAWDISMALFASNNTMVQYFAANLIYTKVRRHWAQLAPHSRAALLEFLRYQFVSRLSQDVSTIKIFLDRVCLALAAVCCRSPKAVPEYVRGCFELMTDLKAPTCRWALQMLAVLPEEVEDFDASRAMKQELSEQMSELLPPILSLCDTLASSSDETGELQRHALTILRAWLGQGVTLTSLAEEHSASINLVMTSLRSGVKLLVLESCNLLSALIEVSEYPRAGSRDAVVTTLLRCLSDCAPSFDAFLAGPGFDEDIAMAVCNCFVKVATQETAVLVGQHSVQPEYLSALLKFATLKPRKISACTFEVWIQIQDIPTSERHPTVSLALFSNLFTVLLTQLMYPSDFSSWNELSGDEDDEDDFKDYRGSISGLDEVLTVLAYSLQEEYFSILRSKIVPMIDTPGAFDWRVLEAVCYSLLQISVVVKEEFVDNPTVVSFIGNITELLLSLPADISSKSELAETGCQFLGSFTFLFNKESLLGSLYGRVVSHLFGAIVSQSVPEIVSSATLSVHKLFVNGSQYLTVRVAGEAEGGVCVMASEMLKQCIAAAAATVVSPSRIVLFRSAHQTLLEAVCQAIASVRHDEASELLLSLSTPTLQALEGAVAQQASVQIVASLLTSASQLVRFGGRWDVNKPQECVTMKTIQCFWPVLMTVQASAQLVSQPAIVDLLCTCFSRVLLSLNGLFVEQFPYIAASVAAFVRGNISITAALTCAKDLVDVVIQQPTPDLLIFHFQLWQQITSALFSDPSCSWLNDPRASQAFFLFVHSSLQCSAAAILPTPEFVSVRSLLLAGLRVNGDKASVKAVLCLLQFLFCPTCPDTALRAAIVRHSCEMGAAVVPELFQCLSGRTPPILNPVVIDTLHAVILGADDVGELGACTSWIADAVAEGPTGSLWKAITAENRPVLVTKLASLAAENKRQFKALLLDITKVCNGEQTEDCLSSFFV